MKVVLLKSWTNKFGRRYPIGQQILCDKELGQELIETGMAREFGVETSKMKTDFFKPKLK